MKDKNDLKLLNIIIDHLIQKSPEIFLVSTF